MTEQEATNEIKRLGDLCDLYAEFLAERDLWQDYSVWCSEPRANAE
jgi:hypothetical protein